MSSDADAPFRPDPRLVPTLTQVVGRAEPGVHDDLLQVRPGAALDGVPAPAQPAAAQAPEPPSDAEARRGEPLLTKLGDDLARRLDEAIARALDEQMADLSARVRAIVSAEVHAAVVEALQRQPPGPDGSENP